jgi:hypothetical protein
MRMCRYKILQMAILHYQVGFERPEHPTNPNNKVNEPLKSVITFHQTYNRKIKNKCEQYTAPMTLTWFHHFNFNLLTYVHHMGGRKL